ncbi:hypothetical protein PWR05_33680 [Paraburkholderia sp. A2RI-6]|uniref:hypothetical protein n=1 Tax=Paraburkholderia sp. A2RI-6 TaxID=3028371 RepID=UPI003B82BEE4
MRDPTHQLSEVITRPHYDLHSGHAERAVVFIDNGGETVSQRFRHIPDASVVCLIEYLSEATFNAFDVRDIELPVSGPGDEARDDDDLRQEIDQRAVRFSIAQTLERNPCTQRKIEDSLRGMGRKSDFARALADGRRGER